MSNLAYYIISDGIGGAEQAVWQTLHAFESNDLPFLIVNNEIAKNFRNLIPAPKVLNIGDVYIHTKRKYKPIRYLLNNRFYNFRKWIIRSKTKSINSFCQRNKISKIHTHLDYALYSSLNVKKMSSDLKLIHTFHGAFGLVNNNKLRPDIHPKDIDHSKINISVFVANYLYEIFKLNNIKVNKYFVVYNGVEKSELAPTLRSDNDKGPFKILYVGGSKYVKGCDILVDTIDLLVKRNYKNIRISVLGPISNKNDLVDRVRTKKLDTYFEFIGFIDPPNHIAYFQKSDILFMPSRSEALPMAAIESIFCDLPIVASNVGGLPEIISEGKNGFLCAPDPAIFSEKLVAITENIEQFRNKTKTYNNQIRYKFDIRTIIEQLNDIYNHQLN